MGTPISWDASALLASIYATGEAGTLDLVQAYALYDVAQQTARQELQDPTEWTAKYFSRDRDCLAKLMSVEDIDRAQALATKYKAAPSPAVRGLYLGLNGSDIHNPDYCGEDYRQSVQSKLNSGSNPISAEIEAVVHSGRFTPLPPLQQRVPVSGTEAVRVVENRTPYPLRVVFSGPADREINVSPGGSESVTLPAGRYKVLGRVASTNVLPFYGEQTYDAATQYTSQFYVK